ncbi:hypothetical protein [Haladaptatus sp. DFWS20]|uniref:hypothetical protein n=1 Tax=Haladaptatus sp. DFWS20 TaxID=3403467 RepID=UPI003EC1079F
MDWRFLAKYGGLYTILFGGGTVTVAYALPPSIRGYALLGAVAIGLLVLGRVASGGDNPGPISGGDPTSAAAALGNRGSNDVFDVTNRHHTGAGLVFYGVGLLLFGVAALLVLL